MPIHHAVLALLEEGDSYGYELRAQFRQMVGPSGATSTSGISTRC